MHLVPWLHLRRRGCNRKEKKTVLLDVVVWGWPTLLALLCRCLACTVCTALPFLARAACTAFPSLPCLSFRVCTVPWHFLLLPLVQPEILWKLTPLCRTSPCLPPRNHEPANLLTPWTAGWFSNMAASAHSVVCSRRTFCSLALLLDLAHGPLQRSQLLRTWQHPTKRSAAGIWHMGLCKGPNLREHQTSTEDVVQLGSDA